jgi:hypothetical protein
VEFGDDRIIVDTSAVLTSIKQAPRPTHHCSFG